jgi:hypothetical protein
MKALCAIVIAVALAGCAVQPTPVQAGDRCLKCRRTISDLKLAAEIVDALKTPFPFRTAGCVAKYVKTHPDEQLTAIFVTDHNTGYMLPAKDAWFVPARLTQPDGRTVEADYYAFGSRSDAVAAKSDRAVQLRWSEVLAETSAQ